MRMRLLLSAALTLWMLTFGLVGDPEAGQATSTPAERFDMSVRADFLAGFSGDSQRLARGMARCESILATHPEHAEALVWHGSGLLFTAGVIFQRGDITKGVELWEQGLGEMSRAVALAPDEVGVRAARGATLFEATRFMPDRQAAQSLLRLAVGDYEHTMTLQKTTFARLSDHARGELLFGLAEGYARLGETDKARECFSRLISSVKTDSPRLGYAKAWLEGEPPAAVPPCSGCH
jgi:hypothetical protein